MSDLPADQGFWLAPDWQRHERCWLSWPFRPESWKGLLDHACLAHAALARVIAQYEPVTVAVPPGLELEAKLQLGRGIDIAPLELDDSCLRDIGPGFLVDESGARAGTLFRFNGWGNRLHGYARDAEFGRWLLERLDFPAHDCPLTLEPGAIQVDSIGTLIALRSAILTDSRNPTLDRRQAEELLATFLGVGRIIWLEDAAEIDWPWRQTADLVRFCGPAHVLCTAGYGADDPLTPYLDEIAAQLDDQRDALGRPLKVERVGRAGPGDEGAAPGGLDSYLNFYLANDAVVVPEFGAAGDRAAQEAIAAAFPGREVVPLDIGVLRYRGLGFHSLTLPVPGGG